MYAAYFLATGQAINLVAVFAGHGPALLAFGLVCGIAIGYLLRGKFPPVTPP